MPDINMHDHRSDMNISSFSLFTDFDIQLFKAGKHYRIYEKLGAHLVEREGIKGVCFSVWAPNAARVTVIGNFNGWNKDSHAMHVRWDDSGIWESFIPGLTAGEYYKYVITSHTGYTVEKADPFGIHMETPPGTASIIWNMDFNWTDRKWLNKRAKQKLLEQPVSIYEMHIGSWRRHAEDNRYLTYVELADELPSYCRYMGYTHVEFMPVMEHPFYGSWGYQLTGYFAPGSRYGVPTDFMYLINQLHLAGIGVILDWVPSHFPTDEHGLGYFDGTHLFEYEDPRKGFHPDWKSFIFNYGRNEVRSFLISNALYWLDKYHIDGLRVDGVASILYLDYSRKEGEWIPNESGGRENLEAVGFLRAFNDAVHLHHPDTFTIAEESTAWPGVTRSPQQGGLGFDFKWMMGWMHDSLFYFQTDPLYRTYHQHLLSFSIYYAFSECFVLPLSHDEVVHGKKSLIEKMPGDEWQKFANLRLLYGYMYAHPGIKMLFMGGEFAQRHEWRHDQSLDWHENNMPLNKGIQQLIKKLNALYSAEDAFHKNNCSPAGFEWIDFNDAHNAVLCWMRKDSDPENSVVIVASFTPAILRNYRIGAPLKGTYEEIFNSDELLYGGSGCVNEKQLYTAPIPKHGRQHSLSLLLPPLGIIFLKKIKTLSFEDH
jgi:1,4-alpha-glucan branching enzyme